MLEAKRVSEWGLREGRPSGVKRPVSERPLEVQPGCSRWATESSVDAAQCCFNVAHRRLHACWCAHAAWLRVVAEGGARHICYLDDTRLRP